MEVPRICTPVSRQSLVLPDPVIDISLPLGIQAVIVRCKLPDTTVKDLPLYGALSYGKRRSAQVSQLKGKVYQN